MCLSRSLPFRGEVIVVGSSNIYAYEILTGLNERIPREYVGG